MSGIIKSAKRLETKFSHPSISFLIKHKFIPSGRIILAGDKSIAHRALILSALSRGKTILKNFPLHDDSLATLNALSALGVKIRRKGGLVLVKGCGKGGLKASGKPIFVNNSGTTLRLLLGVLAGMDFKTKIVAGEYLSRRPMSRVNVPLRLMGARITARIKNNEEYAPVVISGGKLKGIVYHAKIASAQVKSAILLAGLFAKGKTRVFERLSTRDHTERMLKMFGANIIVNSNSVTLNPNQDLVSPGEIYIPGDISSAAFFIVLAALIPKARIIIEQVSLNPGRSGIINVLKRMQAKIKVVVSKADQLVNFEPQGNLTISSSKLKGTVVYPKEIPSLVDELPILMVAACFAGGRTIIKGVSELRVKETDRINSMVVNLRKMGAEIRVTKVGPVENIIIQGRGRLCGSELKSFGDHRTAMSMVVAALAAEGESRLDDISCVSKSFPGFLKTLESLA
ncbi:MAG: 3-phosphoshikimate 1-carboxyvinyltransferase [Candidatus Omnitrophica bacterium]|nr:3-phosphoshikimate 1-carboxyvinyltransferase [Candidatus Omnitrophota bacterium]MBU4303364.1 3-phosphoshikimate 1-carboxyvinyltransferase [Candidatus Omnitrophota bacterium]MBU4419081.1 3-phosphoshikimate 1-carboxyvinyltransferase [Candidatus Omnitrophota bacterium]MBU4467572.1 3-phosphoshikimate 1-carboxyvinyltransferase [Candidatus Omnitrophota bacterium]MCG2707235.1 3-phosphoshikimate 1-carboxyvinyltransferase [Candidatus Omnitrophota bacterium]